MARQELTINGTRWVHITQPRADDFSYLEGLFSFHPLIKESIASPTLHPLVEDYSDHLYLILHFPVIYETWRSNQVAEIDFLITRELLVTITYLDFQGIEKILKECRENPPLQRRLAQKHTGLLLYHIVDRLFQGLVKDLDYFEEELTAVENKIFERRNGAIVEEIAHLRRDILDFRRALRPQSAVLPAFAEKAAAFYGKTITPYLSDLIATEAKIRNITENQKETIEALYQTNESLVSSNISKIIALLTIFSTVVLPLNFMASIWGMNHERMPLRDGPFDFWIIMAAMAGIAGSLLYIFKKQRWL